MWQHPTIPRQVPEARQTVAHSGSCGTDGKRQGQAPEGRHIAAQSNLGAIKWELCVTPPGFLAQFCTVPHRFQGGLRSAVPMGLNASRSQALGGATLGCATTAEASRS